MRNSKWKWSKSTSTYHIQLKHNGAICRRNHQALQKSTANKSQITPFDVDFIVDQKKYNICNIQFPGIPCRPFSNNQSRSRHKYQHTQTSQTSITSHVTLPHTVWAMDKRNKRFYDNQWITQLSHNCEQVKGVINVISVITRW